MHLDFSGLHALWARIGEVFARRSEAAHSLSRSGTVLNLTSVSGGNLSSVDLDAQFATNGEAGSTLSISGRTITLLDVNGASNGSVTVPLQDVPDVSGLMHTSTANGRFGSSLHYNSSAKQLSLISYDGTVLSTVTLS